MYREIRQKIKCSGGRREEFGGRKEELWAFWLGLFVSHWLPLAAVFKDLTMFPINGYNEKLETLVPKRYLNMTVVNSEQDVIWLEAANPGKWEPCSSPRLSEAGLPLAC